MRSLIWHHHLLHVQSVVLLAMAACCISLPQPLLEEGTTFHTNSHQKGEEDNASPAVQAGTVTMITRM